MCRVNSEKAIVFVIALFASHPTFQILLDKELT